MTPLISNTVAPTIVPAHRMIERAAPSSNLETTPTKQINHRHRERQDEHGREHARSVLREPRRDP